MTLVDSVEAGRLTISELIDALAKDKNYTASRWYQRYRALRDPLIISPKRNHV